MDVRAEQRCHALGQARWPGRFEVVRHHPLTILDGAHNLPGIEALCASLVDLPHPRVIVFAALADKQTDQMVQRLSQICDQLIVTQFDYVRAQKGKLLQIAGSLLIEDWRQALKQGAEQAKTGSLIVTGSLYFISEVRAAYDQE